MPDWMDLFHTLSDDKLELIKLYVDFHVVAEVLLLLSVVHLLVQKRYKPDKGRLSRKEVDALCAEWEPESLVPKLAPIDSTNAAVVSAVGQGTVTVDGQEMRDFGTYNFLGFLRDPEVNNAAERALRKYGCGSCGPRGFYGTVDVHLDLEKLIAKFYGCESGIIYSFDVATISSVIPAFCKRGDIVIYDQEVSFPVQQGINLTRSVAKPFPHNDMIELQKLLESVVRSDKKKEPQNRRFIVVEGLYGSSGHLCPLRNIVALAKRYKFRIIMDESLSLGTLGSTGRGACEHWDVNPHDVDIMTGSMSNSLASVGGYCVGSLRAIDHQRLSSTGYCFSASLPPFNASAVITAIDIMSKGSERTVKLRAALNAGRTGLIDEADKMNVDLASKGLKILVHGESVSPIQHLRVEGLEDQPRAAVNALMHRAVERCHKKGVAVTVARYSPLQECVPDPSIRVAFSSCNSPDVSERCMRDVVECLKEELLLSEGV